MSEKNLDNSFYPYLCLQKIEIKNEELDIVFFSILLFISKKQYTCLYTSYDNFLSNCLIKRYSIDLSIPVYEVL